MAATLPVLTWLRNAFAVLCGQHGDVAHHAQQAGCSRQVAYHHADKVHDAIADTQLHAPSRQQLLQQLQQLQEENRQLWQWLETTIDCPDAKCMQFAVTASAMGLSLSQVVTLLAVLLPACRLPSRAKLGRWVRQQACHATKVLRVLDRACRAIVVCLCLDEIFFRRQPVLMGVEPSSMAWVLGRRTADRSGWTWAKALVGFDRLQDVAADGGGGIDDGLKRTAQKRQRDAAAAGQDTRATPLHVQLDVFHTRRDGAKALRLEWRSTEALWDAAAKLERAKGRFDRSLADGRHFNKGQVAKAWAKAEAAFWESDRKDKAWQRAVAALAVWRPDGRLNDRAWASAEIAAAVKELAGPRWAKVRRMLQNPRTLTFLDRLHEQLVAVEPRAECREVLLELWRWRQATRKGEPQPLGVVLWETVCRGLGEGWQEKYRRIKKVLSQVLRSSSAVECVNSVLRMHQGRHRKLTQELIDLKRLYWNCREFVSGKRRGRCPYEHLGLDLPTYDAWELLQMNPKDLKQRLSSPAFAA